MKQVASRAGFLLGSFFDLEDGGEMFREDRTLHNQRWDNLKSYKNELGRYFLLEKCTCLSIILLNTQRLDILLLSAMHPPPPKHPPYNDLSVFVENCVEYEE
jgi:hypothetical protein